MADARAEASTCLDLNRCTSLRMLPLGEHFPIPSTAPAKLLQADARWMDAVEGGDKVGKCLGKFVGEAVMQRPPAFSAIHVSGKRAWTN